MGANKTKKRPRQKKEKLAQNGKERGIRAGYSGGETKFREKRGAVREVESPKKKRVPPGWDRRGRAGCRGGSRGITRSFGGFSHLRGGKEKKKRKTAQSLDFLKRPTEGQNRGLKKTPEPVRHKRRERKKPEWVCSSKARNTVPKKEKGRSRGKKKKKKKRKKNSMLRERKKRSIRP